MKEYYHEIKDDNAEILDSFEYESDLTVGEKVYV